MFLDMLVDPRWRGQAGGSAPSARCTPCTLAKILCLVLLLTSAATSVVAAPKYRYDIKTSLDQDLCQHMQKTLSESFDDLWGVDFAPYTEALKHSYMQKYGFPLLPGVQRDLESTIEMAFSKLTSAPEFDAVRWQEGKIRRGAPDSPTDSTGRPFLISYVDIDNDGATDSVMKHGFTEGYEYIVHRAEYAERLTVWRSSRVEIAPSDSLWAIQNEADPLGRQRARLNGSYLRLFVYKRRTYVMEYRMNSGEERELVEKPPYKPQEAMHIFNVQYPSSAWMGNPRPEWDRRDRCVFSMTQIDTEGSRP